MSQGKAEETLRFGLLAVRTALRLQALASNVRAASRLFHFTQICPVLLDAPISTGF
jgi:hypothetical protein